MKNVAIQLHSITGSCFFAKVVIPIYTPLTNVRVPVVLHLHNTWYCHIFNFLPIWNLVEIPPCAFFFLFSLWF